MNSSNAHHQTTARRFSSTGSLVDCAGKTLTVFCWYVSYDVQRIPKHLRCIAWTRHRLHVFFRLRTCSLLHTHVQLINQSTKDDLLLGLSGSLMRANELCRTQ